jgi:hypothetical protein
MAEKRNVYRLLVGKPEGKRPLGRPRRRWIDNIKVFRKVKGLKSETFAVNLQYRIRQRNLKFTREV